MSLLFTALQLAIATLTCFAISVIKSDRRQVGPRFMQGNSGMGRQRPSRLWTIFPTLAPLAGLSLLSVDFGGGRYALGGDISGASY